MPTQMDQFKKFVEPVAPLAQSLFEFIKTPIGITVLVLAVLSSLVSAFAHHRGYDGRRGDFGGGCPMMQRIKGDDKGGRQGMMNHMQDKGQGRYDDQFQGNDRLQQQDDESRPENRPQDNQNPGNMPQANQSQPSPVPSTGTVATGN